MDAACNMFTMMPIPMCWSGLHPAMARPDKLHSNAIRDLLLLARMAGQGNTSAARSGIRQAVRHLHFPEFPVVLIPGEEASRKPRC